MLQCIARDPDARLRDIAEQVGITERAAQRIVADLVDAHYVQRTRVGRRNRYEVDSHRPLHHPQSSGREVGELLDVLMSRPRALAARGAARR